jgi:hypothetical protein
MIDAFLFSAKAASLDFQACRALKRVAIYEMSTQPGAVKTTTLFMHTPHLI